MLISKALFTTRFRRMLPPITCGLLAVAAIAIGGWLGVIVAAGFVLLAVLFKMAAELSGQLARLASQLASFEKTAAALATGMDSAQAGLSQCRAELDEQRASTAARFDALDERQQELVDQIDRITEGLKPIRRHRLSNSDSLRELRLRPASDSLLRSFKGADGGPST